MYFSLLKRTGNSFLSCETYRSREFQHHKWTFSSICFDCQMLDWLFHQMNRCTCLFNCFQPFLISLFGDPLAWRRSYCRRLWLTWRQSSRTSWRNTQRPSSPQSSCSQSSHLLLQLQLCSVSRILQYHGCITLTNCHFFYWGLWLFSILDQILRTCGFIYFIYDWCGYFLS